jgi:hypothetical protein
VLRRLAAEKRQGTKSRRPHPNSVDGSTSKVTPLWQVDDGLVFNLLPAWAPDAAVRKKILVGNPARRYEFSLRGVHHRECGSQHIRAIF